MKEELPDSYIPTLLRKKPTPKRKKEIRYGIGIEHTPKSIGMTDGPFLTLVEALETIPDTQPSQDLNIPINAQYKIIRFNEDGTDDVIYFWSTDHWKRNK